MLWVRVNQVGSMKPVLGGFRGHAYALAWPGCNVVRDHGTTVVTFSQIVDGDLSPLVR